MNEMNITAAQYGVDEDNNNICVNATIDGVAMPKTGCNQQLQNIDKFLLPLHPLV